MGASGMNVVVDHQPLKTEDLGLRTVGQMLNHLRNGNRLVVQLLVDGEAPDLDRLGELRRLPLSGHSVFVETASPSEMALEVLDAVSARLRETDQSKREAVDLLRENQCAAAMQKLTGCFGAWQHAQESLLKTAQLLNLDLARVQVGDRVMAELMDQFSAELRQVREALESRDFVLLSDTLSYEMEQTTQRWLEAIQTMRQAVSATPVIPL